MIPGVTMQLINEATSIAREAITNEQGDYNFAAVTPGVYTVKATLTGFKTYENKGVRIATQQFVTLDITLDVGQLQETITVTGEAPLIDTSNASTGGVIDSTQLQALPSGGRSAFLFTATIPTVVASGDSQLNRQQDQTNAALLSLGELRIEVLNVTNTPKVRGPLTGVDGAGFGQVRIQSGFMRLTQLTFRMSF